MQRLESQVRRELARFDGLPPARLQRLVEIWPAAVGDTIARNAWPARLARDGTLHVATSSSTWAFELGQLASEILAQLGEAAPARLRFTPGPIPEALPPPLAAVAGEPRRAGPEEQRAAAELVAGIDDEDLREKVAKAAALSLARTASDHCF